MLTLAPLVARALRKFGFDTGVRNAAVKHWVVEPACQTVNRPAFFDETDVAKVTGFPINTDRASQMESLTRALTPHKPVMAHLLRDAVMLEGKLFRWNLAQPLLHHVPPKLAKRPELEIPFGVMASTEVGIRFFGHWLLDDIPLGMLASSMGPLYGVQADTVVSSPHQARYLERLGGSVTWVRNAVFRELVVLDEVPESPYKAQRYRGMRERLGVETPSGGFAGVMILRKATGMLRILENEDEVATTLERRGFKVIDPMTCGVDEILSVCRGAKLLVGVEGSHLAHGFLPLSPDGGIFTLQPPFKFDHFWRARCNCVGASYGLMVGDATEKGFHVDIDLLQRKLDLFEAFRKASTADLLTTG